MHDNDANSFMDQLLDASLAGYAAGQPRAGLEERIFARLAEQPEPPALGTWRWLPVSALAVVALLAAALLLTRREVTRVAQPPAPAPAHVVSTPAPPPASTAEKRPAPPRPRAPQSSDAVARAAQFPTPGSLTEEERLLMRYLDSSPRELLVASVRTPGPLRDLHLREVAVPTLELKPLPEQSVKAIED